MQLPFAAACCAFVPNTGTSSLAKPQSAAGGAPPLRSARKPSARRLLSRLVKGFKSLSQIFTEEDEDEEEEERKMVIGLPTDVKHVAHIGLDGSSLTGAARTIKSWNLNDGEAPPSSSFRQLELAAAVTCQ